MVMPTFVYSAAGAILAAYEAAWWWTPALAGLCLILAINAVMRERNFQAQLFAIACLPGVFVVLGYYLLPGMVVDLTHRPFEFPAWHPQTFLLGSILGAVGSLIWLRSGVQIIDAVIERFSVKSGLERVKKTDIRYIGKVLPPAIKPYDPARYFKPSKGIFIGLDRRRRPIYCAHDLFDESHLLLCGRTRSFKGVAAQIVGAQSIRRKELFVVLDPKFDAWMPHVFAAEAKAAGQPYVLLDLRQSAPPQINPFDGADAEEVENLSLAAFSLAERGDAADFYRVGDRRAALECARLVIEMRARLGRSPTAVEIMATEAAGAWREDARNFWGYMMEMADLPSVNARNGISLDALVAGGGCLYILGDMQNSRVVRMQRLFLLRLMQLAKKRIAFASEPARVIRVFADEFTVHISRPFLVSLAASAGWRMCVILAFQTLGDLADCPADLTAEAVKAKVWENCALKLVYAVRDSDTAEWLASSTGTIQVDDEMRRVDRNLALSESLATDRSLRQSETYLIDVNMLLGLPKGCGVLFGAATLPEFCYTSPMPTERASAAVSATHVDMTAEEGGGMNLAASMVNLE